MCILPETVGGGVSTENIFFPLGLKAYIFSFSQKVRHFASSSGVDCSGMVLQGEEGF